MKIHEALKMLPPQVLRSLFDVAEVVASYKYGPVNGRDIVVKDGWNRFNVAPPIDTRARFDTAVFWIAEKIEVIGCREIDRAISEGRRFLPLLTGEDLFSHFQEEIGVGQ